MQVKKTYTILEICEKSFWPQEVTGRWRNNLGDSCFVKGESGQFGPEFEIKYNYWDTHYLSIEFEELKEYLHSNNYTLTISNLF